MTITTVSTDTSRNNLSLLSRFGGGAMPMQAGWSGVVRVHVTHACVLLRTGMAQVLSAAPGFDVRAEEFRAQHANGNAVVVTDYATAMRMLRQPRPPQPGCLARILIVTDRHKEWEVRQAVECGVHGYLLQSCAADELVRGVGLVGQGAGYLSPTVARSVMDALGRTALTQREHDVLRLVALGNSDKLIASELGIGLVTVKTHVVHLLQKLDATARTHAVIIAIDRGLLTSRD